MHVHTLFEHVDKLQQAVAEQQSQCKSKQESLSQELGRFFTRSSAILDLYIGRRQKTWSIASSTETTY